MYIIYFLYLCGINNVFLILNLFMRKCIYLFVLVLLAVACKKEAPQRIFDPDAMIVIRGVNSPGKSPAQGVMKEGLTDLEVVQKAVNIKWTTHWTTNKYEERVDSIARPFIDAHKDFDKPALLMWGTDVIGYDGEKNYFEKIFLFGYDVFITDVNNDTIAYVPNEVLEKARQPIEDAWNRGDYDEVYRMFNEAFTFLPIKK